DRVVRHERIAAADRVESAAPRCVSSHHRSNARAAANQDPCLPPQAGAMYFNVAPRQSFFVLPVGGSATFEADAFSLAPMSDWTLLPQDWSDSTTSYLSFSIDGATSTEAGPVVQVNDGATVRITVTLTKDPGALDVGEA